jgi:hypothetical protein
MAAGASLSGIGVLPPGPDATLAKQLDAILGPLARMRGTNARLSGSNLRARASAAANAAQADSSAARALIALAPPSRNQASVQALAGALRTEAADLTSLARAAGTGNRSGYAATRQLLITASRRVSAAASALVGQRLPQALPALAVPGLPPLPRPKPPSTSSSTSPTYTAPATTTTTNGGGGGGHITTPSGGGGGHVTTPSGGGGGGGGGTITTPFN